LFAGFRNVSSLYYNLLWNFLSHICGLPRSIYTLGYIMFHAVVHAFFSSVSTLGQWFVKEGSQTLLLFYCYVYVVCGVTSKVVVLLISCVVCFFFIFFNKVVVFFK